MQEEHDDSRAAKVGCIHVAQPELHLAVHARGAGVRLRSRDESRIDLDAYAARAEVLRRGNWNPPVAGPKVEDHILRAHSRKLQHLADDGCGRRLVPDLTSGNGPAAGYERYAGDEDQSRSFHQTRSSVPEDRRMEWRYNGLRP
jgi:hypothetical protein